MDQIFIFDRAKIGAELDRFVDYAQALTEPKELSTAIQAWDTIASVAVAPPLLAQANLSLGRIYREWDELFTAQRFLAKAHEVEPADPRSDQNWSPLITTSLPIKRRFLMKGREKIAIQSCRFSELQQDSSCFRWTSRCRHIP